MDKIKISVIKDNFEDFIDKIKDLTDIGETIKIKIDNDNIFMYSMLGETAILAFKSFLLKSDKYLKFKDEIKKPIEIIITNTKRLVKSLDFIKKTDSNINLNISCEDSDDDVFSARTMQVTGGKLRINWPSSESYEIKNIDRHTLDRRLDFSNRKWSFIISKDQFEDIKKLSNINSSKLIDIVVNENGKVVISESSAWDYQVSTADIKSTSFVFNKRFLKCIDGEQDEIQFNLFENFILIKQKNSNLMLSYEQDFSDEEL